MVYEVSAGTAAHRRHPPWMPFPALYQAIAVLRPKELFTKLYRD